MAKDAVSTPGMGLMGAGRSINGNKPAQKKSVKKKASGSKNGRRKKR